jgi:hypothetical protein
MEYSQAAELPVVVNLGDRSISLPPLYIGDYDGWCAEINTQRKQASKKLIPASASDVDKFKMARIAEFEEIPLDVISSLVFTPKGAARILGMSLEKSGITSADERAAILKKISARDVVAIAYDVSGLFEKRIPPQGGTPVPNLEKEPEANADPAATGS